MGTVSVYLYDFDDPYKILASHIVGEYRPADVLRVLSDDAYLKNMVTKEVRLQDMGGYYIDCIIEDILAHKKRMEYMHQLDELGSYFFSKLDKERLRTEIKNVLEDIGIEVSDSPYSTGGSASSANT